MAINQLSEENRTRLDSIVKQMVENKETDDDIRAVVEDFKSRYGAAPQKSESSNIANVMDRIPLRARPASPSQAVYRLAADTAETITPPLSIDQIKRLLSPRIGQYGLGRFGQEVAEYGRGDISKMARQFKESDFGKKNPTTAKIISGGGELAANMLMQSPEDVVLGAGIGQTINLAKNITPKIANAAARRALGYQKSDLMSAKSYRDSMRKQANAKNAADLSLKEGAISKTGSVETTASNLLKLNQKAGIKMKRLLEKLDSSGQQVNTTFLAEKLKRILKPIQPDELKAFDKILEELGAPGRTTSYSYLKTKIKPNLGKSWDAPPSNQAIQFMRRASNFIENEITEAISKNIGKDAANIYRGANKTYGLTKDAANKAYKAVGGEMGNNLIGLPTYVAGSGALMQGNLNRAFGSIGLFEALRRRAAGVTANLLNPYNKIYGPIQRNVAGNVLANALRESRARKNRGN